MKSGIRNVTSDFSPEHGDDDDANRHAVVEKRKTGGTKEFGPSQRSAEGAAAAPRKTRVTAMECPAIREHVHAALPIEELIRQSRRDSRATRQEAQRGKKLLPFFLAPL